MKLNKILFSSILALFACIMPTYATGPYSNLGGMLTIGIPLIGIIILLIKFGIAYLFLKKDIVKKAKLLESIFLVNTLTIIIIIIWSIFSMILGNSYRNIGTAFLIIGVTLMPLISDYYLMKWQLKRLENEKLIITKTSNSRLVLMVISMYLANAVLILILFRDLIF